MRSSSRKLGTRDVFCGGPGAVLSTSLHYEKRQSGETLNSKLFLVRKLHDKTRIDSFIIPFNRPQTSIDIVLMDFQMAPDTNNPETQTPDLLFATVEIEYESLSAFFLPSLLVSRCRPPCLLRVGLDAKPRCCYCCILLRYLLEKSQRRTLKLLHVLTNPDFFSTFPDCSCWPACRNALHPAPSS